MDQSLCRNGPGLSGRPCQRHGLGTLIFGFCHSYLYDQSTVLFLGNHDNLLDKWVYLDVVGDR